MNFRKDAAQGLRDAARSKDILKHKMTRRDRMELEITDLRLET